MRQLTHYLIAVVISLATYKCQAATAQEVFWHGLSDKMSENFQPPPDVSAGVETVIPIFGGDGLGEYRASIEQFYNEKVEEWFKFHRYLKPTASNVVAKTTQKQLRPHIRIFGSGLEKEHQGVSIEFTLKVFERGVKPMLADPHQSYTTHFVIGASKKRMVDLIADVIANAVREAAIGWQNPKKDSFYLVREQKD